MGFITAPVQFDYLFVFISFEELFDQFGISPLKIEYFHTRFLIHDSEVHHATLRLIKIHDHVDQLTYDVHCLIHVLFDELLVVRFEVFFYDLQVAEVEDQALHLAHDLDGECAS